MRHRQAALDVMEIQYQAACVLPQESYVGSTPEMLHDGQVVLAAKLGLNLSLVSRIPVKQRRAAPDQPQGVPRGARRLRLGMDRKVEGHNIDVVGPVQAV